MPRPRTCFLALLLTVSVCGGLVPIGAVAQAPLDTSDSRGSSIEGGAGARDNTRAYGTVFDPQGNPIPKADVWVVNDASPATRMRVKSRPSGVYQVRNVGRLRTATTERLLTQSFCVWRAPAADSSTRSSEDPGGRHRDSLNGISHCARWRRR